MIAKLAFLTTPAPGIFVLNFQLEGENRISRVEISKAHLANILIDGTALALRENSVPHRVIETLTESANEPKPAAAGA